MNKKILIILTGGTIGSNIENNVINTNDKSTYNLINEYQKKQNNEILFDIISPYNILSENINHKHWNKLISCLNNVDFNKYNGIIITHGSDTIAYTAALIGYCFRYTNIPIILTASNYPLSHPMSNGLDNFISAVNYIKYDNPKGIFVIYQNNKKQNEVYLATRIQEADTFADQFTSYNCNNFGYIKNDMFIIKESDTNPSIYEINKDKNKIINNISLQNNIMLITPYPGINYNNIAINNNIKAVLHWTYHAATLCSGTEFSVIPFIEKCKENNIDFYMLSKNKNLNLYNTSKDALDAGAIPIKQMSKEAAYMKLLVAYNQNDMPINDFLNKNIYYEIIC